MKFKTTIIMLIILITLPLSGCSETSQLHQKLIIQGIGVDQNEEGNYDVTIQAYDYQNSTSEGEIPFKTLELSGSRSVFTGPPPFFFSIA